jgi:hypothetical protein
LFFFAGVSSLGPGSSEFDQFFFIIGVGLVVVVGCVGCCVFYSSACIFLLSFISVLISTDHQGTSGRFVFPDDCLTDWSAALIMISVMWLLSHLDASSMFLFRIF